jgi:uncharacterized protein (TIGR00251 family)
MLDELRERLRRDGSLHLRIKATPKSAATGIAGVMEDGTLRVKIAAAPERGRANAELCAWLARQLGVPQRNVSMVAGETSALKRVVVKLS